MTMQESVIEGKLITDTQVKRFHGRSRVKELHLYKLKVDFISDSTTTIGRALKMESVMSSFRLFMATSIGARQPQSVQGNLNLCRATSICAKQPQSVQNNLNSCKTTSIRAEKKNPKSNGLFQEAKTNFRTRNFFSGQGIYIKNTFRKKNGGKASNLASAVAETVCPPCIRGRHPQLDYLTRPKKSSWATNQVVFASPS